MPSNTFRSTARVFGLIAVLAAVPLTAQIADSKTASQDVAVAQLQKEVENLRMEVLQLRIEAEQTRIEALERETRKSEADLRALTNEEEALRKEIENIQREASEPGLSPAQQAEINASALETLTTATARIRDDRVAVEHRLSANRAQLATANQKRSRLLGTAGPLGRPSGLTTNR